MNDFIQDRAAAGPIAIIHYKCNSTGEWRTYREFNMSQVKTDVAVERDYGESFYIEWLDTRFSGNARQRRIQRRAEAFKVRAWAEGRSSSPPALRR